MFNKSFNAEEMLEAGVSAVKKQVTAQVNSTGNSISTQLGTNTTPSTPESLTTQGASAPTPTNQDQATNDFVKDLYGTSDQSLNQNQVNNNQTGGNNQQNTPLTLHGKSIDHPKTPEEAERLARARKGLMEQHMSTYYKPTFETHKKDEDTAERLEREEQEKQAKKMEELKVEQKKKEVPLAVQMGANQAEKFRGAAG